MKSRKESVGQSRKRHLGRDGLEQEAIKAGFDVPYRSLIRITVSPN